MNEPLVWHVEQIAWGAMIPFEFNPRKMSVVMKQKLRESYQKFGNVELPVLDYDNMIIAGHQRQSVKIADGCELELTSVVKPNRKLTELEYKEYNIISNALKGDFVGEILAEHFSEIEGLADYGLQLDDLDALMEKEEKSLVEAEMPIVPKMAESYTSFVIVCKNEVDATHLAEKLGVNVGRCYKSSKVGMMHVLDGKEVIRLWN
jgi:hypothetical protein